MATKRREKQLLDVSGGVREHRTTGRSGPVTGANMVGRLTIKGKETLNPSLGSIIPFFKGHD